MGVCMAMGASTQRIRQTTLRQSMTPVITGVAAGTVLSIASGRYLEHLIANAARPAIWTFLTAAGFLLFTAMVASWSASRSVLSINPVDALRAE
jgi:ABC-type antimicrobial peptide transport system permease subunit